MMPVENRKCLNISVDTWQVKGIISTLQQEKGKSFLVILVHRLFLLAFLSQLPYDSQIPFKGAALSKCVHWLSHY